MTDQERRYASKFETLRNSLARKKFGTEIKRKQNGSTEPSYIFILSETFSLKEGNWRKKTVRTYFDMPLNFHTKSASLQEKEILSKHQKNITNGK